MNYIKIVDIFLFVLIKIEFSMPIDLQTTDDGKYFEVIIDRFEVVLEDTLFVEFQLKVRKINKIRKIVGYIVVNQPLGNEIKVEAKSLKKQGGEYRYLVYSTPRSPICEAIGNDPYCWPQISKSTDFPEDIKGNCPIVPKNYSINGVYCDLKGLPKVVSSGDYATELIYSKDGNVLSIYRIYGTVNYV